MKTEATARLLNLEGARNFRDLGGYPAASGRTVKWGVLFRSDYLAHLTEQDCEVVRGLGLNTVFDLRSGMERERHPSRWHPRALVETVCWPDHGDIQMLGQRMEAFRSDQGLSHDDDLKGFLCLNYRDYLDVQAHKFGEVLRRLTRPEAGPALIHCTAGKDRTGILVALLLYVLGVEWTTIMDDYLQTNQTVGGPDEEERFRLLLMQFGFQSNHEGAFRAMRFAHPEYLQAAFDGIQDSWGSVDNYLDRKLGIDEAKATELQTLYLA